MTRGLRPDRTASPGSSLSGGRGRGQGPEPDGEITPGPPSAVRDLPPAAGGPQATIGRDGDAPDPRRPPGARPAAPGGGPAGCRSPGTRPRPAHPVGRGGGP